MTLLTDRTLGAWQCNGVMSSNVWPANDLLACRGPYTSPQAIQLATIRVEAIYTA